MLYGYGQRNNLLFGFGGSASGFPSSLAYSANGPRLALGGAATAYPPTLAVQLPFAAQTVGDAFRIVVSSNLAFSTIVLDTSITLTGNAATDIAAINATLAAITTPAVSYIRCYCAGWSNVVLHGTAAAPSLTSAATANVDEFRLLAQPVTFSMPVYAVLEGADAAEFELVPSAPMPTASYTLRWIDNGYAQYSAPTDFGANNVYNVSIEATGINGAVATVAEAITVLQLDGVPDAFTFTGVSNATWNTAYSSNTITVAGVAAGVDFPGVWSGDGSYTKNGVAGLTAANFTFRLGDTFSIQETSGGADFVTRTGTLNLGGVIGSYIVSTPIPADPPGYTSAYHFIRANSLSDLFQDVAASTPVTADGQSVGFVNDRSGNGFHFSAAADNATRPNYRDSGGVKFIESDGFDAILRRLAASNMYSLMQGQGITFMAAARIAPSTAMTWFGEGRGSVDTPFFGFRGDATAGSGMTAFIRNDGNVSKVLTTDNLQAGAHNDTWKVYEWHCKPETLPSCSVQPFVNGVAGTKRTFTADGTMTVDRTAYGAIQRTAASGFANMDLAAAGLWPLLSGADLTDKRKWFGAQIGLSL